MGVQIEEHVTALAPSLEDPGFIDLVVAGAARHGEFRCSDCGYGAIVQRVVPLCPMCGGAIWEHRGSLERRFAD